MNIKPNKVRTKDTKTSIITALPILLETFLSSLLPKDKLKSADAPSPNKSAKESAITVNGYTIFVAVLPRYPTPQPINIWSTMLYKAPTNIEIIQGIEKLSSNLLIFSLPKS